MDPNAAEQAELLRIQILLTELGESDSVSETRSGSIDQGSRFREKMMLILQEIETLTTGEESPQSSLGDLYAKVSLDFYLTVIQAFLMELMSCGPSLIIRLKDQIQKLSEGSKLFRKYSSILPLKNASDMDLISGILAGAAHDAETVHDFFHEYPVTEDNINDISMLLSVFLKKFEHLNTKMQDTYLQFRTASMLSFPKTLPGLTFVDSFLERLGGLVNRSYSNECSLKPQVEMVLAELNSLRASLKLVGEKLYENPELIDLKRRIAMAAYQADYIIDSMYLLVADQCYSLWLSDVIDEMHLVKKGLIRFIEKNKNFVEVQEAVKTLGHETTQSDTPEVGEIIVSLDDQESKITELLMNGKPEGFMVGIVGMAGIGKTTLAKKVYDRPDVKMHFQKLAWCCISEEFRMREVLLKILRDINPSDKGRDSTDQQSVDLLQGSDDKTEGELLLVLRQNLMGKKYLIVMDDVWKEDAWTKLKLGIQKDSCGSRILFTSRNETVLSSEKEHIVLHSPRYLEAKDSWELLQKKLFGEGNTCPMELMKVGLEIAKSCEGVPLTVVTIAGLLKTKRELNSWNQIKEGFSTHILDPESQCNRALQLSYKHLPDDLKPCFLYFAAFRKDLEIPVNKLTTLWIAEGFIRKADVKAVDDVKDDCKEDGIDAVVGGKDEGDDDDEDYYDEEDIDEDDSEDKVKDVEDVALDYVEDFINRCLIMAARRGSSGKVKTCKIHDLWHNLCSAKAKDDNFFESITGYADYYPSNTADHGLDLVPTSYPEAYISKHRLSIFSKRNQFVKLAPSGPPLRTLLFFGTNDSRPTCPYDVSFIPRNFKILRVLDIESINMDSSFSEGIVLLDPLTYLAVGGDIVSVPSTIQKLWNLETFIVNGLKGKVALPSTIWSMPRLRHLHVYPSARLTLPDESHASLNNLVTLSSPSFSHWTDIEEIIKRAPQLKKLRCTFFPDQQNHCQFLDPQVMKLQSLKVLYTGQFHQSWDLRFPSNLKKLSLRSFRLTWNCISSIGELPRLEALTLVSIFFDSPTWEMEEEKFPTLRILKLDSVELSEWVTSSSNFQSLERLVLWNCEHLEAVPPAFGDNLTLQIVEMMCCSTKAERSLKHIEERQQDRLQKKGFKVVVNDPAAGFRSSV